MDLKDYHYTMMHVCFERPSTIRGFNNLSLANKTHILAHQYSSRKIHIKIYFCKSKYKRLPLYQST